MFTLAVDYSMLFTNIHVSAFCVGAVVYLGYTMLPMLRRCTQPTPCGDQPTTKAEQLGELCRQITPRRAAAGGAMLALLIGLALTAHTAFIEESHATCPVDLEGDTQPEASEHKEAPERTQAPVSIQKSFKFRGPGPSKFIRQPAPSVEMALPTVLLAQAHAAASGRSTAWPVLEACATWLPPATGDNATDASELFAQFECNRMLLEGEAITHEAAPALLSRARQLMGAMRDHAELPASTWASVEVEWARITHGVFQLNCKAVADDLQMSRRAKASTPAQQQAQRSGSVALAALRSLKRLEAPFRENLIALAAGSKVLESRSQTGDTDAAEELRNALGADRSCALQALQEGRAVAQVLPRSAPLVRRALQCQPHLLENFQATVLREATEAKDAATIFALGLYYSDIGLASEQGKSRAPLFGAGPQPLSTWTSEPNWLADAGGSHAPSDIVQAEELLLAGEEASVGPDRSDRGAARALRLYQHGKMLALKHHDSAAEWRYRAAAELASSHRRQKLAAHALGRLGYFLSLRGRKEEALEAATVALKQEEDPLSQYLQVSLRRSLGALTTSEEVHSAERTLSSVAGKLPSKTLEDQRAAAHAELGWWRLVATEGLHVCLRAWDAAQMLICVFCGLAFQLPGGSSN